MNKSILTTVVSTALLAVAQASLASDVTIPNTFTAGTPAVAVQVNANFAAVEAAVDDNDARIDMLETQPSISGNLTLVPSTATAGNILRGTQRFLHNYGTENTFLGRGAGNYTMTGINNTVSGAGAFISNTAGSHNTVSGTGAMNTNSTGSYNTANGIGVLNYNSTGGSNTASGAYALFGNLTGGHNTASGASALGSNTIGSYNTASGEAALAGNTAGNSNIALGYAAGFNLTTGDNNIAIGNAGVAGEAGTIRIGSTGQSRAFIAGIRGVTTVNVNAIPVVIDSAGQLGTVSSSRRIKDDIADMGIASDVLMKLRPVTFHYKSDRNPATRALQYGLVAEEVAKVAPELVAYSTDGAIETVFYQHLTPMLLNEYQKQQHTIQAQTAMLSRQTARIAALEKQAAEVAELRLQVDHMTAVLSRMRQPDRIAAVGRK
jgi:hypothetical protein